MKPMKKQLLYSAIFFLSILGLNAQNDFRKMNWYESSETLMEKYPEVDFLKEKTKLGMAMTGYAYIDLVSGIETRIMFLFINDEFVGGAYQFTPDRSSFDVKDFVKDFDKISDKLQSKYEMERSDVWYKDNNIDVDLMGIDHYLIQGDVELQELGLNEGTSIIHFLENKEGHITHFLIYRSSKLTEMVQNSLENDF
jgi:hypothetical protein